MKTIFIVAGETSGDRHGASLVKALQDKHLEIKFFGLGGKYLQEAGVKLLFNITDLAVVGFFEVLHNLAKFRSIFVKTLNEIKRIKPACCILIDYPGFNLRLARELKKMHIPVIYYISPQVWAWHRSRVKLIKKYVDKMIVVFEFEKEFYRRFGIEAEFVGHPLLDAVEIKKDSNQLIKKYNLKKEKTTIALLPGSRKKEIQKLLPIMLESARIIDKNNQRNTQFIFIQSNTLNNDSSLTPLLEGFKDLDLIKVSEDEIYDCLSASDLAIVASGTATLETALTSTPMVIIYKLNLLSWMLARLLVKIPYIGLVNVVAGEKVVPELIQFKAQPRLIGRACLELLSDKGKYQEIKLKLDSLKKRLGKVGASKSAAEIIAKLI
ncbi:MAG: lipid-A-disaccharide synthase [Candidatus Omnitrophica bacterium]|nr:lipid-A-disaccharide synthase [Candidatus Omnitrophota bacterium]